jgi:hypothetical protein
LEQSQVAATNAIIATRATSAVALSTPSATTKKSSSSASTTSAKKGYDRSE